MVAVHPRGGDRERMDTMTVRLPLEYIGRTGPVLRVERYRFRSGEGVPQHSHEFIEIAYVVRGRGVHVAEDGPMAVAPGHVFIIVPGMQHAYRSSLEDPMEVVNVLCGERLWEDACRLAGIEWVRDHLGPPLPFRQVSAVNRWIVEDDISVLLRELGERRVGFETVAQARLCELLAVLHRDWREGVSAPTGSIIDCLAYVRQHAHESLTINQLARMASMSRAAFTAQFRKATGTSLIAYRNAIRVERAQTLLKETDMPISSVAQEVGFVDAASFYRVFRMATGLSPQGYRRSVRIVADWP